MRFAAKLPWKLGGPDRTLDIEHQALLDTLAPGWDVSPGTEIWAETRAEALAATMIWAINRRVANQSHPLRMSDLLADFEDAASLRVTPAESLVERRRKLAAKLRGIVGNDIAQLAAVAQAQLGPNFVALTVADPSKEIVYWPGISPGPPGYEWSSNRCVVAVHMNRDGLSDDEYRRKSAALAETLDHMRPSWLAYTIGVGSGPGTTFIVGKGIVGMTIL